MNDDPGGPKLARRVRPTRRLPKHASRVEEVGALELAAVSGGDESENDANPTPDPPPSAATVESIETSSNDSSDWSSAENEAAEPPKPDLHEKWAAEQSPLMAALSAVAEATAAATMPPPAERSESPGQERKPLLDDEDTTEVLTVNLDSFGADEVTSPGEPSPPANQAADNEDAFAELDIEPDAVTDTTEIAPSDRPGVAINAFDQEVKTRPKIRLPEGARRAQSPRTRDSSVQSSQHPPVPTGEGIIRSSQVPGRSGFPNRSDRESDVPTRPRIPLSYDMALAAGRVSTVDLARAAAGAAGQSDDTRSKAWGADGEPEEPAPSVVVTRAKVISDHPPGEDEDDAPAADGGESRVKEDDGNAYAATQDSEDEPTNGSSEAAMLRPSRRSRPDSEEFEMLDLDEGEEEPSQLELSGANGEMRANDIGARVTRTPPPPPQQNKRSMSAAVPQRQAPPPPPPGAAKKPPPNRKAQTKKRAWWEVLFSDDYVRTLPRPSPEAVAKQVNFMESSLGISRGDAVLDVGCGLGQHALEFARRGYLVVALDLALSMITRAAEEAQQSGLRINFLHKDIRDIGFEGTFDAIICVGTTFGFFDDEQNRGVLQRLSHALKPGGRLLLEVVNRDYVLASQPNLVWFEGDGCVVMEESDFNYYASRLNVKRTMMREDGRQSESEYTVRLYSVHELGQMLKQAGFGIKEVSGQEATRGLFFGSQSSRIIMLAERKAQPRTRDSVPPETE